MHATLNPAALDELVRRALEKKEHGHPREPGLHVSHLVQCRRRSWYELHGHEVPPHSIDKLIMFMMGEGHHLFLQRGLSEKTLRWQSPSGFWITGNVDLEEQDVEGNTELKTTRYSAKKMVWDMQQYIEQVCSYNVMDGMKTEARIYVFHLLGDYTGAKQASGAAWDLSFEDHELVEWRDEMDRRAATILDEVPPSLDDHRDWECQYCPFLAARGGPCPGSKGTKFKWFVAEEELAAIRERIKAKK